MFKHQRIAELQIALQSAKGTLTSLFLSSSCFCASKDKSQGPKTLEQHVKYPSELETPSACLASLQLDLQGELLWS